MDVVTYVLSKRYTDSQVASIEVGESGKVDYLVVEHLPTTGEEDTIYLVYTGVGSEYDEYAWKDGSFKKLKTKTISDLVKQGYYYGGVFWTDDGYSTRLPDRIDCLYLDMNSNQLYYYSTEGQNYVKFLSMATPTRPGIMKLYDGVGNNVDGTMTQGSITTHLKQKVELNTGELSEECLGFTLNKA